MLTQAAAHPACRVHARSLSPTCACTREQWSGLSGITWGAEYGFIGPLTVLTGVLDEVLNAMLTVLLTGECTGMLLGLECSGDWGVYRNVAWVGVGYSLG